MIQRQRDELETVVHSLIEGIELSDDEEIDLIKEFAYPLPVRIITRIMGLPLDDHEQLSE
jgi:cytochrome P450